MQCPAPCKAAAAERGSSSCCPPPLSLLQGKQAARDEQGVLGCLKRALKIANAAQQQVAPAMGGWGGCVLQISALASLLRRCAFCGVR